MTQHDRDAALRSPAAGRELAPDRERPERRRMVGGLTLTLAASGSVLVSLSAVDIARAVRFAFVVSRFRTEWALSTRPVAPTLPLAIALAIFALVIGLVALGSRRRDGAWIAAAALTGGLAIMGGFLHALSALRMIAETRPLEGALASVYAFAPLATVLVLSPMLVAAASARRHTDWPARLAPIAAVGPLIVAGVSLASVALSLPQIDVWDVLGAQLAAIVRGVESARSSIVISAAPAVVLAAFARGRPAALVLVSGWLATGAFLFVATRPLADDASDRSHDDGVERYPSDVRPELGVPPLPDGAVCEAAHTGVDLVLPDGRIEGQTLASSAELAAVLEVHRRNGSIVQTRFAEDLVILSRDPPRVPPGEVRAAEVGMAEALPWLRVALATGYRRLRVRHTTLEHWSTRTQGTLTRTVECDRVLTLSGNAPDPRVLATPLARVPGTTIAVGRE